MLAIHDAVMDEEVPELEALLRQHEAILWQSPELGNMPFLANPLQVGSCRIRRGPIGGGRVLLEASQCLWHISVLVGGFIYFNFPGVSQFI